MNSVATIPQADPNFSPRHPFKSVTREQLLYSMAYSSFYEIYKKFPQTAEVPVATFGEVSPLHIQLAKLAENLITEECVNEPTTGLLPALRRYIENPSLENIVSLVDGGIDTVYVILQMFHMLELPFEACFAEVHANNLQKIQFDEHGKLAKRPDGKLLKPENHPKPDLFGVLEEHGNQLAYERKQHGADNWKPGEV